VRILCACNYIGNACRFLFRCGMQNPVSTTTHTFLTFAPVPFQIVFNLDHVGCHVFSQRRVGNPFLTLATTSPFQSDNLRSSRSTFASSPGLTSPSRKYITWLTKGSSSLMTQLQTVSCRVTISTSLCNVAYIFVTDTLNILCPVPFHPPIRSPHLINQVRAIIQIQ
jgi:hypothetical protein